jgi:hypothetical protein
MTDFRRSETSFVVGGADGTKEVKHAVLHYDPRDDGVVVTLTDVPELVGYFFKFPRSAIIDAPNGTPVDRVRI